MKKLIILIALHLLFLSCAQVYPLNTYSGVPNNAYIQDLNNDLVPYEGTWKGTWDNKIIYVYFERIQKLLDHKENNPYYKDLLVGKFKVINQNGLILYDNTNLLNEDAKIEGGRFFTIPFKQYYLFYIDPDICNMTGRIYINFINANQTQLQWKFSDTTDIITSECQYYNTNPLPQPLPANIVLTKQ
ncbi:DUF6705 family protein [Chryseobacterium wangxinyae]|uniref:DUF6705 family protein n=1 Tax=Chryseobacterium sp. CY353 TaxID=2997334 RepID=UPI00226DC660|nr:DUF6705 family protein [Chryseobacterium sp. CY353]MCY0969529.1 hypothetical protein [Chryseobacterium sp. CY353]